MLVIYFSCKYSITIHNAPLDVNSLSGHESTSLRPNGLMRIHSLPHLCAHLQTRRAFQWPKDVTLLQLLSHNDEMQHKNSTKPRVDVP